MCAKIQTIKDLRLFISRELEGTYPERERWAISGIIIRTVSGISKTQQHTMTDHPVNPEQFSRVRDICRELKTGKPLQFILGETTFYNCTIRLNNYTFIPRPETEELVNLIIHENRGFKGKIIDIGTGSGCIAIALATNLPGSEVIATDVSDEALRIAEENAAVNNATIRFIRDDIFRYQNLTEIRTDIIVSNPPYVRDSEQKFMNRNVLEFEPHSALFVPDSDPLIYYKAILKWASATLKPNGRIYFEINEEMGRQISELLSLYSYSDIKIIADINGKDRIIKGTRHV